MKKTISKAILTALMLTMSSSVCVAGEILEPVELTETSEVECTEIEYFVLNEESVTETYNSPRYTLLKQLGIGLTIKDRTANIIVDAGTYEKMSISISAELQQFVDFKWKTIKSFSTSEENTRYAYIEKKYALTPGYDYRVVSTVTADDGVNTETVTKNGPGKACQ